MVAIVMPTVHVFTEQKNELYGLRDVIGPSLPAPGEGLLQGSRIITHPIVPHGETLNHHFGCAFQNYPGPDVRSIVVHGHRHLIDRSAERLELPDRFA